MFLRLGLAISIPPPAAGEPADEDGLDVYGGGEGVAICRGSFACCSLGWRKPEVTRDVDRADCRFGGLKCLFEAAGAGTKFDIRGEPRPPSEGERARVVGLKLRSLDLDARLSRSISTFFKFCRKITHNRSSSDRSLSSVSSSLAICCFVKSSMHFADISRAAFECSIAIEERCRNIGCVDVNGGGGRNGSSPGRKSCVGGIDVRLERKGV